METETLGLFMCYQKYTLIKALLLTSYKPNKCTFSESIKHMRVEMWWSLKKIGIRQPYLGYSQPFGKPVIIEKF